MNTLRSRRIWPREVRLFEAFKSWQDTEEADDLRESGDSTDFPSYMAAVLGKRLMHIYRETPSIWRQYTSIYSVPDFKPLNFVGLHEAQNLMPVNEMGEYKDTPLTERTGVTLTVKTYGALFSLTRKALINDDVGMLRDVPGRFGRAAARSVSQFVVTDTLEANPLAYDGTATFHTDHGNLITDALSETGLANAAVKMALQTDDDDNPIALRPEWLIIPQQLELTARRILNSTEIHIRGTNDTISATPAYGMGNENVMRGFVRYAVERYLTDPNDWYLIASPLDAPVLAVGFLNGAETPQIMLKDPGMINAIGGGRDPYTMEFDQIWWKIRHEWGTAMIDWRGAVKSAVT